MPVLLGAALELADALATEPELRGDVLEFAGIFAVEPVPPDYGGPLGGLEPGQGPVDGPSQLVGVERSTALSAGEESGDASARKSPTCARSSWSAEPTGRSRLEGSGGAERTSRTFSIFQPSSSASSSGVGSRPSFAAMAELTSWESKVHIP